MIVTIRRDLIRMQVLFLLALGLWASVFATDLSELQPKIKQTLLNLNDQKEFSKEFNELQNLSEKESMDIEKIWSSPAYPWKWRWFCAMYLAENITAKHEALLLEGLNDPLFLIRLASIKALSSVPGAEKFNQNFVTRINDDALIVRKAAIQALSLHPNRQSLHAVENALFDDKNRLQNNQDLMGIRESLLAAIVAFEDKQSIHTLVRFMKMSNRNSNLGQASCMAMKKLVYIHFKEVETKILKQDEDACVHAWIQWYQKHQSSI